MTRPTPLFIISIIDMALVTVIGIRYSYHTLSAVESIAGFILLLAAAGFLWIFRRRSIRQGISSPVNIAILVGVVLGLLWVIEIGINNFIAPPLPARDIIDNIFWAFIALAILLFAVIIAFQTDSMIRGIEVAAWSGFVSGLLACTMALSIILFAMPFITQDPLNAAEWADRGAGSSAPSMAAYFAFETLAGAMLHLVVLGIMMGALLGVVGGAAGKTIHRANRLIRRPS